VETEWGCLVQGYNDYVQYARDCMRHARTATTKEVAAELERIAREYQEKAARLAGGELPDIRNSIRQAAAIYSF
jgi:hypothetical protein